MNGTGVDVDFASFGLRETLATETGARQPRLRRFRPGPPEEVTFPVTPMLDMAFQLLAFFILTFKPPSDETRLDMDVPVSSVALPPQAPAEPQFTPIPKGVDDLENDLVVRAEADDLGDLKVLTLGEALLPDLSTLADRLRRYTLLLEGRPLRVRLLADDGLRYELVARVIATCSASGVAAIRLAQPGKVPALPALKHRTEIRAKPGGSS
jgi:biopolymer transport protein ExbD